MNPFSGYEDVGLINIVSVQGRGALHVGVQLL